MVLALGCVMRRRLFWEMDALASPWRLGLGPTTKQNGRDRLQPILTSSRRTRLDGSSSSINTRYAPHRKAVHPAIFISVTIDSTHLPRFDHDTQQ